METVNQPTMGQRVRVGGIDWDVSAIAHGVTVVCTRADIEGEPDHYLKIFSYPLVLHERVVSGAFAL